MNRLSSLLDQPTYFILGAGASKAYSFPLWEDLKNCVLGMLIQELTTGEDENRLAVCRKWHDLIMTNDSLPIADQRTVDHLIESNSKFRVERQIVLNMMKRVLADSEKKDKNSKSRGWIEDFVKIYINVIDKKKRTAMMQFFRLLQTQTSSRLTTKDALKSIFINQYIVICATRSLKIQIS